MSKGVCRLCKTECDLQLSHILPAFVFKWFKKTSATGYIRLGNAPDRRVQDGWKKYWLCSSCESLFSKWEGAFASKLFNPYLERSDGQFVYDQWLLRFCVSVSWRVVHYHRHETESVDDLKDMLPHIDNAEKVWKDFLLGRNSDIGAFQQHLLPLGPIESASIKLSSRINRYLLRAIDMDIVCGKTTCITYSKLGRFIIVGLIKDDHHSHWRGTKVCQNGTIRPRKYEFPRGFEKYLNDQSLRPAELMATISVRQRERIEKSIKNNPTRFIESESYQAISHDIRLSGPDAFAPPRKPDGNKD